MRTPSPSHPERGPGRPREPEIDQRIIEATLRLLSEQGFARMSMDQIALEAGVTKPTIYRRYSSKTELALAAIRAFCAIDPPTITGDTRSDLIALIDDTRRALDRAAGMGLIGSLLSEERETPELLAAFRTQLVRPRRKELRTILERAQARGEIGRAANLDIAIAMLSGSYYAMYIGGTPLDPSWSTQLVSMLLRAIG